jgi:hypothetical protein
MSLIHDNKVNVQRVTQCFCVGQLGNQRGTNLEEWCSELLNMCHLSRRNLTQRKVILFQFADDGYIIYHMVMQFTSDHVCIAIYLIDMDVFHPTRNIDYRTYPASSTYRRLSNNIEMCVFRCYIVCIGR